MPGPLPKSLRDRVVEAYHNGEGSFRELGERFKVGEASVNRWVALERRHGTTAAKPMGGARRKRRVTPEGDEWLRELVRQEPWLSLPEMSERYEAEFGVSVDHRMMSRTMKRLGITKKKRGADPRHPNVPTWSADGRRG